MKAALTRYRVMAWVTGVMLLVLVLVAMPMKYIGGVSGPVAIVGTAHGWLYLIYLITAVDLTFRMRWSLWATLGVLIAGTVPFASFFAEHWVTKKIRQSAAKDWHGNRLGGKSELGGQSEVAAAARRKVEST